MDKKNKYRCIRIIGWSCALFFILSGITIGIVWLNRPAYIVPDTSQWKTGDIFFSVGDSWESVAVRTLTGFNSLELSDSTPSHCGVVIRLDGDVKLVHESTLAKNIVIETPEEYLKNNGSYCLYARKPPCLLDNKVLLQVIDSLIVRKVPFDFDFDHSSSESLYCTELVIKVFEICGYSGFSGLREQSYIYPTDILNLCDTL